MRAGRPGRGSGTILAAALAGLAACCGSCGHNAGGGQPQAMIGPVLDGTWTPIMAGGAPSGTGSRLAVWSGSELIVWSGSGACLPLGLCATGARYDPARDQWSAMATTGAPAPRDEYAATWTGQALFVWGGRGCGGLSAACGDGALYGPNNDGWVPVSSAGAAAPRGWAVGVWTGIEAFLWGGEDPAVNQVVQTGGLYDPVAGMWRAVTASGAPGARRYHSALWSGHAVLIWGGSANVLVDVPLADGAAYDPSAGTWRALSTQGAPAARWAHAAVWTGSEMIVWGGLGCGVDSMGAAKVCADGGRYDPLADRWRPLSTAGAPSARVGHTAVWTGRLMIVWGGMSTSCGAGGGGGVCSDGAAYDPATDQWRPLVVSAGVLGRTGHVAAWTGSAMIAWGGTGGGAAEASLINGVTFVPANP